MDSVVDSESLEVGDTVEVKVSLAVSDSDDVIDGVQASEQLSEWDGEAMAEVALAEGDADSEGETVELEVSVSVELGEAEKDAVSLSEPE